MQSFFVSPPSPVDIELKRLSAEREREYKRRREEAKKNLWTSWCKFVLSEEEFAHWKKINEEYLAE